MSVVLVTGATGTVGYPIARRLAERGDDVRALVRDVGRAEGLLPSGVSAVAGDVTDVASVHMAAEGCELVFHAAGLPEQWRLDPTDFRRVNVNGTSNVIDAARRAGVRRLVYTSTIDVFAWEPGRPFDESTIDPDSRPTFYERSKQEADRLAVAALAGGLDTVFLHPSAVYGPSPALFVGANDLIARLARREIPMLLPGGMPVVFAEDVGRAHIEAADRAQAGARYIVADRYLKLSEIARAVAERVPGAKVPPVAPLPVARALAVTGERLAKLTRRPPLIPRGAFEFLISHPVPVSDRLTAELGIELTAWEAGLDATLEDFRSKGWIG